MHISYSKYCAEITVKGELAALMPLFDADLVLWYIHIVYLQSMDLYVILK